MTTLKQARNDGKIEDFILEHEKEGQGDLDKLDATIKHPVHQTSSKAQKASSQGESDD